ncbi:MAG: ABC transporter ATP-binding protein [Thermomicrobiales bacterium]
MPRARGDASLDDRITAEENLRFHCVLYHVPRSERRARIQGVFEMVAVVDRAHTKVRSFSGGMKRRLEIARGLLHRPAGLFLDEPTVGLDPQTRQNIWEHITALRREHGVTVFMTTHYMDEAEYFDRIGIMDHTYLIALDTPYSLITEGIAGRRSRATSFRRQPGDDSPAPSGIWRCGDRRSGYRPVSGRRGRRSGASPAAGFPSLYGSLPSTSRRRL